MVVLLLTEQREGIETLSMLWKLMLFSPAKRV
jgi:hypothetical protein